MTAPDLPAVDTTTTVPVGFSEGLGVLATISTLLIAIFGHDWGVAKVAQDISVAGPVLIPIVLSYTRALKHQAAAQIKATALQAAAASNTTVITAPVPPVAG